MVLSQGMCTVHRRQRGRERDDFGDVVEAHAKGWELKKRFPEEKRLKGSAGTSRVYSEQAEGGGGWSVRMHAGRDKSGAVDRHTTKRECRRVHRNVPDLWTLPKARHLPTRNIQKQTHGFPPNPSHLLLPRPHLHIHPDTTKACRICLLHIPPTCPFVSISSTRIQGSSHPALLREPLGSTLQCILHSVASRPSAMPTRLCPSASNPDPSLKAFLGSS